MYETEKRIIQESYQLFILGAKDIIECDQIQDGLFNALELAKGTDEPSYIKVKDAYQFDDPCIWLLKKSYHPEEIEKEPDPREKMMRSRLYDFGIVLWKEDYAVNAAYEILKPHTPNNVIDIILMNLWVTFPSGAYTPLKEGKPSDGIDEITYNNGVASVVKI
jgi:hypothetical protein